MIVKSKSPGREGRWASIGFPGLKTGKHLIFYFTTPQLPSRTIDTVCVERRLWGESW